MNRICVFTGTNFGEDHQYLAAAQMFGRAVAARGWTMVYGGGRVGLMGAVADAALKAGGEVIGVITQFLVEQEIAHAGLTTLHVVESMHERKAMMSDLSHGFVAMPGGIGTFEEFFEVWTSGQLGAHSKPCGLFNVGSFYTPLLDFLDQVTTQGFLTAEHRGMVVVAHEPDTLLDGFQNYRPPKVSKWMSRGAT